MQLVPGDIVLMKNDAFQGKQKVKDWWSETEYVVVRQVTDGIPAYEVKDGECEDHTLQPTIPCSHPKRGHHALGSRRVNFKRRHCSVHLGRAYLLRGRERFARGIHGWG